MHFSRRRRQALPLIGTIVLIVLCLAAGNARAQDELDALFGDAPAASPPPSEATESESESAPETDSIVLEEAPAPPVESRRQSRLIEEIVVTAQKREENIRDVPISVQAFSADYLAATGVTDQRDLPKITPGLVFSDPIGFATAYIRGIGSDAFILADPLVVSYVDDVYFPNSTSQFLNFGNVERIEVLKGPQGTLFGRNALGGTIKVDTRDPDLGEFSGALRASYASAQNLFTSGYISVPLRRDSLALGVSAYTNRREDFRDGELAVGLPSQRPLPTERNEAYRIKLLWRPSDRFDLQLNVFEYDQDNTRLLAAANTVPSLIGSTIPPQDADRPRSNDDFFNRNEGLTVFGELNVYPRWFDVKLLASRQEVTANRAYDFDGSPQPIAYFEGRPIFADTVNAELRLLSNDAFGPSRLKWIAGLYFFDSEAGIRRAGLRGAGTSLSQGIIGGVPVPGLAELIGLLPVAVPDGVFIDFSGRLQREELSAFVDFTYDFNDWFSASLGGRYQDARRIVLESGAFLINTDGSNGIPIRPGTSAENDPFFDRSTASFDPKAVLNVKPAIRWLGTDPLLYLSYQTASIADTFNVISPFNEPNLALGSEVRAYEIGFKSRLFGLIDLNAAVFHYTETDAQVQIISLQTGGAVRFENADELRIRGAEIGLQSEVLPGRLPGSLVFSLGGTWLDPEYTDYDGAGGFTGADGRGPFSNNNDFTGNQVVQASPFSGNLGLNQTLFLPGGPLELNLSYQYSDGFFLFAQNTPNVRISAYSTVGFQIAYTHEASRLRLALFGENVLDENYLTSRFITDFGVNDTPAEGAVYGSRIEWSF